MTDWNRHLAVLRAYVAQDFGEYDRLRAQLDPKALSHEYTAVVAAGFIVAVQERFGRSPEVGDITMLVASTRALSDTIANRIDPTTAERLIKAVTHGEDVEDLSSSTVVEHEIALIAAMVSELELSDQGVDEYIVKVQAILDETVS